MIPVEVSIVNPVGSAGVIDHVCTVPVTVGILGDMGNPTVYTADVVEYVNAVGGLLFTVIIIEIEVDPPSLLAVIVYNVGD